jgi:hypothetical protein
MTPTPDDATRIGPRRATTRSCITTAALPQTLLIPGDATNDPVTVPDTVRPLLT